MEVSGSDDELLTVLAKFRQTLLGISLPPPAPVDYDQALKDARRESIEVGFFVSVVVFVPVFAFAFIFSFSFSFSFSFFCSKL